MHLLERPGALAELDEIYRQWTSGALTLSEYKTAFAQIDAAHSHTHMCANNNHRIAVILIAGRALCGVCWRAQHEVHA